MPALPTTVDRRSGADRRQLEADPPVKRERRRTIEPRKPAVDEFRMTDSLWGAFDGK